jgi:hypothetical protein
MSVSQPVEPNVALTLPGGQACVQNHRLVGIHPGRAGSVVGLHDWQERIAR